MRPIKKLERLTCTLYNSNPVYFNFPKRSLGKKNYYQWL